MKRTIFTGAGVAIVTPMNADGTVNFDKLRELVDFQIENKTDAIIVCGTTGESSTLDHEEHVAVIDCVATHTAGRIPVVAGVGSNDTAFAVELCKSAKESGVDGLLAVTPYYNKTSQAGLVRHFNTMADATDLPMILYNVPSRTALNIQPATYAELCKHPNIVATKEANDDIVSVAQTRSLCGDELAVYSGNDNQIIPIMSLGGIGVISVLSNMMPREVHDICQLYLDGKTKEAADLQIKLHKLMTTFFIDVNPIPIKEAMNAMGMNVGPCRLPLIEMAEGTRNTLYSVMKEYQLLK